MVQLWYNSGPANKRLWVQFPIGPDFSLSHLALTILPVHHHKNNSQVVLSRTKRKRKRTSNNRGIIVCPSYLATIDKKTCTL